MVIVVWVVLIIEYNCMSTKCYIELTSAVALLQHLSVTANSELSLQIQILRVLMKTV